MSDPIFEALFAAVGQQTTIHQGGSAVAALPALIGASEHATETDEGATLYHRSVDFLYLKETFRTFADAPIAVNKGTEFRRIIDGQVHVHQALPRDRMPDDHPIDPNQQIIRVHTQFVRSEPVT
jgi:hypothetical protein